MSYLKTQLTELDENKVSIKTQKYIMDGETEYPIDLPHRRSFVNSIRGRAELHAAYSAGDVAEADYNAIIAKWGDTPAVVEPEQEEGVI